MDPRPAGPGNGETAAKAESCKKQREDEPADEQSHGAVSRRRSADRYDLARKRQAARHVRRGVEHLDLVARVRVAEVHAGRLRLAEDGEAIALERETDRALGAARPFELGERAGARVSPDREEAGDRKSVV